MQNQENILLVEDDRVDVLTIKRVFRFLGIENKLIVCEDGEIALEYLNDNRDSLPRLILLDLNMPKVNGLDFLKIIKNDEDFKIVPVVVLTTSNDPTDRLNSFKFQAAGYMVKSVDYEEFVGKIASVKSYWTNSESPF